MLLPRFQLNSGIILENSQILTVPESRKKRR
jgi:hypothetical protein